MDRWVTHIQTQAVACNYTYYHKAVVKQNHSILLATNAFCCKYDGGLGTQFINLDAYRANGSRAMAGGSLMAFLLPVHEQLADQFSLTGTYTIPEYEITATTSVPKNKNIHWPQAPFYYQLSGFDTNRPLSRPAIEAQERYNINNTVVYHGHYLCYYPSTKTCDKSVPGAVL